MLENLILGLASLFSQSDGLSFQEKEISIPAGVSQIVTEMEWNAVTLFTKDGSPLPKIWYERENGFEPWNVIEEEDGSMNPSFLTLLTNDDESRSLKIKSDAPVKVVGHFFNTRIPGERLLVQAGVLDAPGKKFEPFDDDSFDDPVTGLPRPVKRPKYITRAEWGANEDLRLWDPRRHGKLVKWFLTEEDLVESKFKPVIMQATDDRGKPLFWPISAAPVKQIIVHHTGEYVKESRNTYELMRAIYFFHTITRGWGDIGYNYVIDRDGNIFEGRAGGEEAFQLGKGVVGAHVAYHNIGTVGISLEGNFEFETPTSRQLEVLTLFMADLAHRFDIDPNVRETHIDKFSYNIAGHRDVAREGHGTACPGKNLDKLLPNIRKEVAFWKNELYWQDKRGGKDARDFLQQSAAAPDILKEVKPWERPEKEPLISAGEVFEKTIVQRNDRKTLDITFKNGTEDVWISKSTIKVENVPQGMVVTDFRLLEPTKPGESGIFRGQVMVDKTENGEYEVGLVPIFLKEKFFRDQELPSFPLHVQVSGDKEIKASANMILQPNVAQESKPEFLKKLSASMFLHPSAPAKEAAIPKVKVRLAAFSEVFTRVKANAPIQLFEQDKSLGEIPAETFVKIISQEDPEKRMKFLEVETDTNTWKVSEVSLVTSGVLEIGNYDRGLGTQKFNTFRRKLTFYPDAEKKLLTVNELPIEEYLWGLAEEPSSEPEEKKKAIHVLARSYALVYSGAKRKFGTDKYDLEDDPATSQFYLGYDWEKYHADQKVLVQKTEGEVLTYQDNPVIGPYFTQSSGKSSDQWKRAYPWARVQELPFDKGLEQKGHGVGLSGNSARELAKLGKNYREVIDAFFEGVKVEKKF